MVLMAIAAASVTKQPNVFAADATAAATSADTPPTANPDLFKYDDKAPLDIKEVGMKQQDGATIRDITFVPISGEAPFAAYIVTPAGTGPFAGVLYVHWLGEPETTNRTEFL